MVQPGHTGVCTYCGSDLGGYLEFWIWLGCMAFGIGMLHIFLMCLYTREFYV